MVVGTFAAWVLSHVWAPLAVSAYAAGLCWGQALLAAGLNRLGIQPQQRTILQAAIGGVTVLAVLLALGMAANRLAESLM